MHSNKLLIGLVLCGIFALTFVFFFFPAQTTEGNQRTQWKEHDMGVIPKGWGELVGVAQIQQQVIVLIFRDGNGTLRKVNWFPNGLNQNVSVVKRAY